MKNRSFLSKARGLLPAVGFPTLVLRAMVFLALVLAVSFSCSQPSGNMTGLSLDSLRQADSVMKAYVDEGKLPCVATLM